MRIICIILLLGRGILAAKQFKRLEFVTFYKGQLITDPGEIGNVDDYLFEVTSGGFTAPSFWYMCNNYDVLYY